MTKDIDARGPERDAIAMIEASEKRRHFTDVRHVTVRWEPYKPDGQRQMKAKGRWQEQVGSGDYWRWQNCDRPAFAHDPAPDPLADPRVVALVDAVDETVRLLWEEMSKQGNVGTHGGYIYMKLRPALAALSPTGGYDE